MVAEIGERSLKEIVLEEGGMAHLFEKHGFDYCCQGEETLQAACDRKGLTINAILDEMQAARTARQNSFLHPDLWSVEFLIEYIVENHHRYCNATTPVLMTNLARLIEHHGDRYPYLKPVMLLFGRAANEIEQHMRKEEMILFPYIKSLASAKEFGHRRPMAPFHTLGSPLGKMRDEHQEVGNMLKKLRALLSNFQVPDGACNLHRSTVAGLQAFTKDVHQHIHLENNLLFPRALALEEQFDLRTGMPSNIQ